MNKKELIQEVAKHSGLEMKDVKAVLHSFQKVILSELVEKNETILLDIGKLKITKRAARTGINPQTRQKIVIPEKQAPKLVTSKKLKSLVVKEVAIDDFDY